MSQQSNIQFAKWLKVNDPFLFEVAVRAAELQKEKAAAMNGLFDFVSDVDWGELGKSVVDTVQKVAPTVVQYKAQAAALKTNIARANQGLPPIDMNQYNPTVKIAAEITPENEAAIQRLAEQAMNSTGNKIKEMLPYVLGGFGLFIAAKKMRVF
jgi:hypothetical protein